MLGTLLAVPLAASVLAQPAVQPAARMFVGSTPCAEPIRSILAIPRKAKAELIEWELTLTVAATPRAAASYRLRYKFGPTRPNQPGLDATAPALERRGNWRVESQTQGQARVVLDNGLSLLQVSDTLLHALAADGRLMVGTGGWSYTLSRSDALERDVEARIAAADPGDSDRTTSRASGESVMGIFDGRTPCQGIARELGVAARPGCWKAKWRLTLFHDAKTRQPTTYRLEGTLYGLRTREASWRITRGTATSPDAEVYELAAVTGESTGLLLKGDDRVLFFLDRQRRPLTGNARNAYTLDRRVFSGAATGQSAR